MSAPKSDKATIAARQNRLLELLAEGKTQAEASLVLYSEGFPADRITLWRDVKALKVHWQATNAEAFGELRKSQLSVLERIEQSLLEGSLDAETGRAWLSVRSEISKLLGLNAENRSIVAHVTSDSNPLIQRFKKSILGLNDEQVEQVLDFAQGIARQRQAQTIDATWFPEPPRLEDGE
jgi:hypothetical protein